MIALPWIVGGGLTAGAAWVDVRTRTIPTNLIVVGAFGALGAVIGGWLPAIDLVWGLVVGVVYTVFTSSSPDLFGGGDLKLAAMTAVWWGPAAFLVFFGAHALHLLTASGWWLTHERPRGVPWGTTIYPWAPFLFAAWVGMTLVAFLR